MIAAVGALGAAQPPRLRARARLAAPAGRLPARAAQPRRARCCWSARSCSGRSRRRVYLAVARSVDLDFSVTGALYLVALTNFVAALPAAPGSIGTFDAAVAFGARRLGASGSMAVTYMLLLRFVLYIPITIVGLVDPGHPLRRLVATALGRPARDEAEAEATRA